MTKTVQVDAAPLEWAPSRRRIPSPSPRNPSISTHSNEADDIDRSLEKFGHVVWGFVIYRTTYKDDAEWSECLRKIRDYMKQSLEFYGGVDLLESDPVTTFEDKSVLGSVSSSFIRDHFNNWQVWAPEAEQGPGKDRGLSGGSPRYNFCIQVDEDSLRSIINWDEENDWKGDSCFVRLVRGNWQADEDADKELCQDRWIRHDSYEDIEGCTAYDVGWAKVRMNDILGIYCILTDYHYPYWQYCYERPPIMARRCG